MNSIRKASSVRNVTQKHVAGRTFTLKSEDGGAVSSDGAPKSGQTAAAVDRVEESRAAAPLAATRPGFRRNLGLTDRSADGDMVEISKGAVTLSRWYLERIQETPSLVFTLGLDRAGQEDEGKSKAFQELLNAIKEAEVRSGRAPAAPDPGSGGLRVREDDGLAHSSRTSGGRPGLDSAGAEGAGGMRPDFDSPDSGEAGDMRTGFDSSGAEGVSGMRADFDSPGADDFGGARPGFASPERGEAGDTPPGSDLPGTGADRADYATPRRPVYRAATDQSAGLLAEKRKKEPPPDSSFDRARGIRGNDGARGTQDAGDVRGIRGIGDVDGIRGNDGARSIQDAGDVEGIQGIRGVDDVEGIQGVGDGEGIQDAGGVQGIRGVDDGEAVQDAGDARGIQGADDVEGIRDDDGAQGIRGVGDGEGIQDAGGVEETQAEEVQDLASFLADLTRRNNT
ncbi:MAG: hypothetical protein LBL26_14155 [Peptococcaceae bacterium]|nr:hypothetical protein [Peptococcaceae bacterium]